MPQEVQDFLLPATAEYYHDKPEIECDEGMRSCGLAGMTIMLLVREPWPKPGQLLLAEVLLENRFP